jgi:hypothetical protein
MTTIQISEEQLKMLQEIREQTELKNSQLIDFAMQLLKEAYESGRILLPRLK